MKVSIHCGAIKAAYIQRVRVMWMARVRELVRAMGMGTLIRRWRPMGSLKQTQRLNKGHGGSKHGMGMGGQQAHANPSIWQLSWGRQGIPEADSDGDDDVAEGTGTLAEVTTAHHAGVEQDRKSLGR